MGWRQWLFGSGGHKLKDEAEDSLLPISHRPGGRVQSNVTSSRSCTVQRCGLVVGALLLLWMVVMLSVSLFGYEVCSEQIASIKASNRDNVRALVQELQRESDMNRDLLERIQSLESGLAPRSTATTTQPTESTATNRQAEEETRVEPAAEEKSSIIPIEPSTTTTTSDTDAPPSTDPLPIITGVNAVVASNAPVGAMTHRRGPGGGGAMVLFCAKRPGYLRRTMDSILEVRGDRRWPLFISQDGAHPEVSQTITEYTNKYPGVYHLRQTYKPTPDTKTDYEVYYRIAQHYGFALGKLFDELKYDRVIMVEEDMEIAPDFFDYFVAMTPLLEADPSLLCVSAWNDNGQKGHVARSDQFYRSECFPGLGWMMTKDTWKNDLGPKWAHGFWDDWLREPEQRQGRSCIYPEMNRVYTFGNKGSSSGQFFSTHLSNIQLNKDAGVKFARLDLSYLQSKRDYQEYLTQRLQAAVEVSGGVEGVRHLKPEKWATGVESNVDDQGVKDYVLWYNGKLSQATHILKQMGMMTDHKAGIPRASFMGVMPVRVLNPQNEKQHVRLFIAPHLPLKHMGQY